MATAGKDPSVEKCSAQKREQSTPKHEPVQAAESTGIQQIILREYRTKIGIAPPRRTMSKLI